MDSKLLKQSWIWHRCKFLNQFYLPTKTGHFLVNFKSIPFLRLYYFFSSFYCFIPRHPTLLLLEFPLVCTSSTFWSIYDVCQCFESLSCHLHLSLHEVHQGSLWCDFQKRPLGGLEYHAWYPRQERPAFRQEKDKDLSLSSQKLH